MRATARATGQPTLTSVHVGVHNSVGGFRQVPVDIVDHRGRAVRTVGSGAPTTDSATSFPKTPTIVRLGPDALYQDPTSPLRGLLLRTLGSTQGLLLEEGICAGDAKRLVHHCIRQERGQGRQAAEMERAFSTPGAANGLGVRMSTSGRVAPGCREPQHRCLRFVSFVGVVWCEDKRTATYLEEQTPLRQK